MIGKEQIKVARGYRAFLEVDDRECGFLAVSDREDPPLVGGAFPYPAGMDWVSGLEETVYANPLLLGDFASVTVLIRGGRFMLVPGFVTDDSLAVELFRTQYPVDNYLPPCDLIIDDWAGFDARLVYEVGRDELSFMRRTFNNPLIRHPLTALAGYFAGRLEGGAASRTLLNVSQNRADIVVTRPGAALCANSFPITGPVDAAYYALAVRQSLSLPASDELMLAGTAAVRGSLTPLLRRGVSFVMPVIEPPAVLESSRETRSLPFTLKVAPFVPL